MTEAEFRQHLPAFADGEADDATRLRVMQYLASHPEAMGAVIHHQQLRQAVGRSLRAAAPAVPADLRARVAAIAPHPTAVSPRPHRGVLGRIGRWAPALTAVAAVLVLAIMLGLPGGERPWLPWSAASVQIVPANMVNAFVSRHVTCSRMLAQIEDQASFPHSLRELPEVVAQRLHTAADDLVGLDLSAAGYAFDRAGMCHVPGRSVHLIYKALPQTGRNDQISLWIQSAADSRMADSLEADKVYRAGPADAAHPIVLWKHGTLIYYVVGDWAPNVQFAANVLRGA